MSVTDQENPQRQIVPETENILAAVPRTQVIWMGNLLRWMAAWSARCC